MWRNCFGFTDLVSSSDAISWRTYSPGNAGIGGSVSVLAASVLPHERATELGDRDLGALLLTALLPHGPERDVPTEHYDVDARGDDVAQRLVRDKDATRTADRGRRVAELDAFGRHREQELVGAPEELVVRPLQPLVGHDAVGEKHQAENEGGRDHGLAPG